MEGFLQKNYRYWWVYTLGFTLVILLLQTINNYFFFLSYFLLPMYLGILLANEQVVLHIKNLTFVIFAIFITILIFGKGAQIFAPFIVIPLIYFLKVEKRVLGYAFGSMLIYNILAFVIMVAILKAAQYIEIVASLMVVYPLLSIVIYSLLCQRVYEKRVLKV